MNKFHFCVVHYTNDKTHYFDGIFNTDTDVCQEGNYDSMKEAIGSSMTPPVKGEDLVLLSLSVIKG